MKRRKTKTKKFWVIWFWNDSTSNETKRINKARTADRRARRLKAEGFTVEMVHYITKYGEEFPSSIVSMKEFVV